MKYDVFISYRREGGYDTAKHLNDLLVRDGYKVSFDIDTLRSGDFDTQLYARIDQCKDFILIVDQHAFDRTLNPNFDPSKDWLRNELAYALKKNKNVIPVFLSGVFTFPDNLPSDIARVSMKHGPEYNRFYFNDFYKSLKERFLHKKSRNNLYIIVGIAAVLSFICFGITILYSPNREQQFDATYVKHLADSLSEKANTLTNDTAQYFACLRQSCNYYKEVKEYYAKIDSFPGDYYASYFMFLEFSRSIPNSQIKTYNEFASEYEKLISQIENDPNKHVYYETLVKSKYWAGVCYYHLNSPELCLLYLNQVEDYFHKIQNKDPINRYEEIVKMKNDLNK